MVNGDRSYRGAVVNRVKKHRQDKGLNSLPTLYDPANLI
jgi:hypothetical protein